MPIPKAKPREKRKAYIDRCMSDEVMQKEYPNEQQRLAVCAVQWSQKYL
jgi:hypothetical protein